MYDSVRHTFISAVRVRCYITFYEETFQKRAGFMTLWVLNLVAGMTGMTGKQNLAESCDVLA